MARLTTPRHYRAKIQRRLPGANNCLIIMFRYHYKSPFKKRTPRVAARPGMKDRSRGTESSDRSYGRPGDARASNGAIELGVQDVGPGSKGGPRYDLRAFLHHEGEGS